MLRQGEIYWIDMGVPTGSESAFRRPHVVVQNNVFNASQINTVVVCAVTTNLRRAAVPGNVLLDPGEGGLQQQSVVNVTQIFTVDKRDLAEKVGTVSKQRIRQILNGINLVFEPREPEKE